MTGYKLVDVSQSLIFNVGIVDRFIIATPFDGTCWAAQPLETPVSDACQQIAFLCFRHQDCLPMKQVFEDVADHILAFLLVVKDGTCHSVHLGIVLLEQPLT
jgi:hypothetical protein